MKITEPKLDNRSAQPYAGIRSQISMGELSAIIPRHIEEVAAWLAQQGVEPAGPPIIRYHSCPTDATMSGMLDIAIGWPVPAPLAGNDHITADTLPAGRYASLIFTGVENGIPGNAALIEWAQTNGIQWDSWDGELGEIFAGRVENMLDGPEDDPDPANWRTEVAILTA